MHKRQHEQERKIIYTAHYNISSIAEQTKGVLVFIHGKLY